MAVQVYLHLIEQLPFTTVFKGEEIPNGVHGKLSAIGYISVATNLTFNATTTSHTVMIMTTPNTS